MSPWRAFLLVVLLGGCGGAVHTASPQVPMVHVALPPRVISSGRVEGSEQELLARGEALLVAHRWAEAADLLDLLVAADPAPPVAAPALFDLALARESLGQREFARTHFRALARRFPAHALAVPALLRAIEHHAYMEEWDPLAESGAELLARPGLTPADRMLGLGARGLGRLEGGRATDEGAASRDIQDGLDLVEEHRVGDGGRLPLVAAMLRFGLGEVRRLRSERITFAPGPTDPPGAPPADFGARLEMRSAGLLSAQSAYQEAMHAQDPHWAAMAGYRVGAMYRALHRDVLAVPKPPQVRSEGDEQIFYAAMHLRYRVLLDKGLALMNATLSLAEQTKDSSAWIRRAEEARQELQAALDSERAVLATFPFTEAEMQRGMELLLQRAAAPARPTPASGRRSSRSGSGP